MINITPGLMLRNW